ncbi:hypothetical protein LPB86_05825 [Pedobacter sp. MC2016-14]|uniref:hypothetical protein n=1 Tax=Pedobacter sp. MC2016-14 TaxID=2897327 RepID=UPI001E54C1F4|nr:hypothetical protein [Pedobacter sp. MC2016-14]MCD0487737.1 hypothetical protein [Pedobacter sp. MC2016-14]
MKPKKIILTRKIQLLIDTDELEIKNGAFKKLYQWQWICFRAANYIFSHQYIQEQLKELIYLTDDLKIKLANIKKDKDGILTTSRENTTYQLLSKHFKGEIPMEIIAALNHTLVAHFNSDRQAYWKGEKSLRNYKNNIPVPFYAQSLQLKQKDISRDFYFNWFNIPFKTYLGKDRSDKAVLLKKAMEGKLKICNCAMQPEKGKIFLLASFEVEKEHNFLDDTIVAEISLSMEYPITLKVGKAVYQIGNREEFLYRRIAIQHARSRLQSGTVHNKGGHGRKRKLKSVEAYKDKEKSYVDHKLHVYSKKVIDLCIKHNAATLLLTNQQQKEELAKNEGFLLRNWSYFGLKEKLAYKAEKVGIMMIVE